MAQFLAQLSRSQISTGIFGAIAVSLAFGAVASGRDLAGAMQDSAANYQAGINRAAKTDRASGVMASAGPTRTISLRVDGLSETSVLVRIPVKQETRSSASSSFLTKSGDRKMVVACEPVVSVLTEVVRHLQPGRCVT